MDSSRHYKALEFDKILELCSEHAICEQAKEMISQLQPHTTYQAACFALEQTGAANQMSVQYGNPGIVAVHPCEEPLKKASVGAMMSMKELLQIASLLRCTRNLITWRRQFENQQTVLDGIFEAFCANQTLEDDITRCILSEDEISDNASPELSDIRRKIRNANQKARDTLDKITRSSTHQKHLQEQIITIRNGRFVVPVRSEYRTEIPGLVHDTSASGATLFVEPISVVELNNDIRELERKQQEEINRILLSLSSMAAQNKDSLVSNYELIVELDVIFAKSKLADRMRATLPHFIEQGETVLKKARHPLIAKEQAVPIDIKIGGDFDTLVITGPNTGGKTVALKTLGLLTLMTQSGMMIPANDGSSICFKEKVLADIGDEQSIEQSLSTFSSHMTNIVTILEQAGPQSLVLIDELGAGTDPVEGAALAVAIIDQLRTRGAWVVATTHYAEIKVYALQTDGVENASCEFDLATLRPTYRLIIGTPGRSNAFAISQRLGLSDGIIAQAQELVSTENRRFEDVVSSLEQARQELEGEKEIAEKLRQEASLAKASAFEAQKAAESKAEKELLKAQEQSQSMLEQVRFQYQYVMSELDELKKRKDQEDFAKQLAAVQGDLRGVIREMEDSAQPVISKNKNDGYRLPRPLKRGDIVYLSDFGTEGTVTSLPDSKGYIRVQAGLLDTKVPMNTVKLAEKKNQKVTLNGGAVNTRKAVSAAREKASMEIDLRGYQREEAILELQQFLDSALLSGYHNVNIIHGKGTGALRKAVQDFLRGERHVKSYRLGLYGEGEDGVTVVELK